MGWCSCFSRRKRRIDRVRRRLLSDDPDLVELDWDERSLTDDDVCQFAPSLKDNTRLGELHLCDNLVTDVGASALASALTSNAGLRELWLSGNFLCDDGAASLSPMLRRNVHLRWLSLNDNDIHDVGAGYLAAGLRKNATLRQIWLNGNILGDEGARLIAEALSENAALELLSLAENQVTHVGAEELAAALTRNQTLSVLGLFGNQIGDRGAEAMAEYLRSPGSCLTELYLGKNGITGAGAAALADALIYEPQRPAPLNPVSLPAFAGGAAHGSTLFSTGTDIAGRGDGGDSGEGLVIAEGERRDSDFSAGPRNSPLIKLWLAYNNIDDVGAAALAHALTFNSSLKEINLGRNNITRKGAEALADALKANSALSSLGLEREQMKEEGGEEVRGHDGWLCGGDQSDENDDVADFNSVDTPRRIGRGGKLQRDMEATVEISEPPPPRSVLQYQNRSDHALAENVAIRDDAEWRVDNNWRDSEKSREPSQPRRSSAWRTLGLRGPEIYTSNVEMREHQTKTGTALMVTGNEAE